MASGARAHFAEDISYQTSRMPQGELNGEEHMSGTGPRQVSGVLDSRFQSVTTRFFQISFLVKVCTIYRIGSVKP